MTGNLRCFMAEFIGTFALILAGAGSVCMDALTGGRVGLTGIALAHGLTILVMGTVYGPVSGGHFNPAVTLSLLAHKRIDGVKAILYVASQLLGAACGGLVLAAVLHGRPDLSAGPVFLGACDLSVVGFKAATLLEALATFILVSALYSTAVDPRGNPAMAPATVGMAVVLGVFATGPLTGAALNPARAFGPAVATGHWANWYVYWVGPLAGGLSAALIQEKLFMSKHRST